MGNIEFNNCDEMFNKLYYLYDEEVIIGKYTHKMNITSKRINYEKI